MFLFGFGFFFSLLSFWDMTWYVMVNIVLLNEPSGECYRWPVTLAPPEHLLTVSYGRNSRKSMTGTKDTSRVYAPVSAPGNT